MKLDLILTFLGAIFTLLGLIVEYYFICSLIYNSNCKEDQILVKKIKGLILGCISVAVGAFLLLWVIVDLLV